ncbi:MAG: hypothetical protein A4S15_14555 [Candidatus Raskinella chloraquaticus]|uniref:Uncharacterized protein n=1 Tax=Candidatus Raskinella chloraquaticus TaxID=1951219 RepID=A0A1W9I284_9HYPH|nr:MAG: hypothetical protein A4S15_14555 [Proteobacteria bacterium SG_bin8]
MLANVMPPILYPPFDGPYNRVAYGPTFKLHANGQVCAYPPLRCKTGRLDSSASPHLPKKHTAIKNCPIKRQPA